MANRWRDPSAFRADPAALPATRPSLRQTLALLAVLVAVAGAVVAVSYLVHPERARAFDLLHGSLFLSDEQSPVAVDLANGKPTLQLVGAAKQVGITRNETLGVVPLDGGTLLLNQTTGEFNMVDNGGFVVKHDGGVPLGGNTKATAAIGVAAGDLAYIARNSVDRSDVYLVSQSTVASAMNATAAVTPRASTALTDGAVDTEPGGAVSAEQDLWALVTLPDGRHAVRQLAYPPGSSSGAQLTNTGHGVVAGPAALTTASTGSGTSVGLAMGDRVTVFRGGSTQTVRFTPPSNVDKILPATNRGDRLAYLMHVSAGWVRVSVAADGSDLEGPTKVTGIPATPRLAQPAYSRDALYTMDQGTGRIYRIDSNSNASVIPGAETYPLVKVNGVVVEQPDVSDAYVIARESRVIFNSGSHADALIVFTDGSHPPERIVKKNAVRVSAAGGAEQLTKSTVNAVQAPPNQSHGGKPRTAPAQAVNPRLDCKNVTQKPHIPVIGPVQAGSRSVTINWTYPIIDKTQDCYPSTYVVTVKLLSANAPPAPSSVTVESQVGATITGLFPDTRYEFTVTAYIHEEHTSSAPFQIPTGPEGPAAPTGLTVAADSSGGWVLNWDSCGNVKQGCVPAQSWTVTPSICDGRGLAAPPTPLTAPADPTSRKQPTARYNGGDALLGRGLRFVVIGSGESQVQGTPSAQSACVYSWRPANPAAMRLSASQPATTSLGGSTTTNVTLDLGSNPVRNVGGVGAQVTFTLSGNGTTQTKQTTFDGNQTALSVNFGGIQAGSSYTASATVRPAHGGSAVPIPSVAVSTRADWPKVGLSAVCPPSATGLSCQLNLQISGISSAAARGEKFDFDAVVSCGSGSPGSVSRTNFDPADPIDGGSINLLLYSGDCSVQGTLKENAGSPTPLVFGGKPVDLSAPLRLGPPPTAGAGQGDFAVAWGAGRSNGDTPITIKYTGNQDLHQLTQNWSETVTPPGGGGCGPSGNDVPDTTLVVSTECIADTGGGGGNWTVQISYTDKSTNGRQGPFTYQLANPVPGYQYCAPAGFDAQWNATKADGAHVQLGGGDVSGCSGWHYDLRSQPPGSTDPSSCGTVDGAPPQNVPAECADDPTQGTWTVVVSWLDSANRRQASDPITVTGDPPTS